MRLEPIVQRLIAFGRLRVDYDTGDIFSPKSNTPEKPLGAMTAKGYLRVCLNIEGRQMHALAHRIVWIAANGPILDGIQIDHINGNKTENHLANLDGVPGPENMRRAAAQGLTNGGWRDGPRNPVTGQFIAKRDGRRRVRHYEF